MSFLFGANCSCMFNFSLVGSYVADVSLLQLFDIRDYLLAISHTRYPTFVLVLLLHLDVRLSIVCEGTAYLMITKALGHYRFNSESEDVAH